VIGRYKDRIVIDAGALALSKDLGATGFDNEVSYGRVVDHPKLCITKIRFLSNKFFFSLFIRFVVSQELGVVRHVDGNVNFLQDDSRSRHLLAHYPQSQLPQYSLPLKIPVPCQFTIFLKM